MHATINIGLAIGDGTRRVRREQAEAALWLAGCVVVASAVRQSVTEPTLVAKISPPLNADQAHAIAQVLEQDCIAQQLDDGSGALHGPAAAKWGEFNPEFFLTFADAVASQRAA